MKHELICVALLLATAQATLADWQTVSDRSEASVAPGIEHRHLVVQDDARGESASLDLALFSTKSVSLRVVDNPDGGSSLADAMRQSGCVAGVNGGYFDPNFAPIGLLIANGKMIHPLQRARLITGVLFASEHGIEIVRTREFSTRQKPIAAVQCGPFLVDLGHAVKGLDTSRVARRTFAAIGRGDRAALGFCSDSSLADLGEILAALAIKDFKVQRALNLDGGSSSGFLFKRKDGSVFSIPEEKTVRDFVGIASK